MVRRLQHMSCKVREREFKVGSGKAELKGQSNCSLQLLKGSYKDDGAKHTFPKPDDTASSQELQFGKGIRKRFLISSSVGKGQQVSTTADSQSLAEKATADRI